MMSIAQDIVQRIETLPTELQQEVSDFVDFLIEKRQVKKGRTLRQDWAGVLDGVADQYSTEELEKKALDWRNE